LQFVIHFSYTKNTINNKNNISNSFAAFYPDYEL
jgi:hypothetical protein